MSRRAGAGELGTVRRLGETLRATTLWLIVTTLLIVATRNVNAECVQAEPSSHIVDVQIHTCETPTAFAKASQDSLTLPWLSSMQKRLVDRSKGLVIKGLIKQTQGVTWFARDSVALGLIDSSNAEGTWHLEPSSEKTAAVDCSQFQPGTVVRLLRWPPCCDVFPPADMSCWFGIGRLQILPEVVRKSLPAK